MRYYLDTNILIFVLMQDDDNISCDVKIILNDYSNLFYVSTIAVQELIQVYKSGDIRDKDYKTVVALLDAIEESGIEIVSVNKRHLFRYAGLEAVEGHKDPNDHIIIAQSISDKIPIISSDRMFKEYKGQGLSLVFNKR